MSVLLLAALVSAAVALAAARRQLGREATELSASTRQLRDTRVALARLRRTALAARNRSDQVGEAVGLGTDR
jgi:hypothetical protein